MQSKLNRRAMTRSGRVVPRTWIVLLSVSMLGGAGCLSPLAKPTAAFSQAADLVIDPSKDVYTTANNLHDEVVVSDAVAAFDTDPTWDPHRPLKVLLTPEQIQARIEVLDTLKTYAQTLADLTNGKSEDLEKASSGIGSGLSDLSSNAASAFGQGTGSNITISTQTASGISTAVLAMSKFLASKKVKSQVPSRIVEMDPTIRELCDVLSSDITVLRRQAKDDFEQEIAHQDLFVRKNAAQLSPAERRDQVASMLTLVRRERQTDELFARLGEAVGHLATTHHALAETAQGKDPQSFKDSVAALASAGQSLGHFYLSL